MSGQKGFTTQRLVMLAMMTAVVFAVNYPRIIIPLPTGETSFTLAGGPAAPENPRLPVQRGGGGGGGSAPVPGHPLRHEAGPPASGVSRC